MTMKSAAGLVSAILLVVAAVPAHAGRPDTRDMTCDQATTLLRQYKAIVFSTGQHVYDRYVSNQTSCGASRRAVASAVPTIDAESCQIGYRCEDQPAN